MRHISYFNDFLSSTVNLNQSRIDLLVQRVETISSYLGNNAYEPRIRRFTPQGSWAHKTIIKPPGDKDFDADLVVIIDGLEGWSAAQYVEELYAAFRTSDAYRDKVSRRTRCVELNYAGDFHLDVVPVIQEIGHNGTRFFACNRRDDIFEETAPEDFTSWLIEKNRITGADNLRKVTRLIKFLRDSKRTFSAKSILLTTLIGMRIDQLDEMLHDQHFSDLSTSLKTVIGRLDDFLQARPVMPVIANPVLPNENFNRHWDQAKYESFREKIHRYRQWIDDAYTEQDNDESIAKWRRVFGDDFAKGVVIKAESHTLAPLFGFAERWLAMIREKGRAVLHTFPVNQDHVRAPIWPLENRLPVTIAAGLAKVENGPIERDVLSGDFVAANHWIKFTAQCPTGIPAQFKVWWRVVNTGGQAARQGQLRGGFSPSKPPPSTRWEATRYRGVHWVEAFVVNPRTNGCVGQSEPFFVVIE